MGEILAFVLYFIAMLGIGLFFFIKEKNSGEKEYFLGGRSMGPWVTAMSAQASDNTNCWAAVVDSAVATLTEAITCER